MAATEITVTKIEKEKAIAIPATAAVDATDGAAVEWDCADGKLLLIVENADDSCRKKRYEWSMEAAFRAWGI